MNKMILSIEKRFCINIKKYKFYILGFTYFIKYHAFYNEHQTSNILRCS